MSAVIAHLPERHDLVTCLHRHGMPYAEVLELLERLRTDGESAVSLAVAAAIKAKP